MSTTAGGHFVGEVIANKRLISYEGRNRHKHHLWMWGCGSCSVTYGPSTISHISRSERCHRCAILAENNVRWRGHQEITGEFLRRYEREAYNRAITWAVTPEYLWQVWLEQEGCCVYTGWTLTHRVDASIDRIDSTKGYEVGNVQWVHREINRMKWDVSDGRFRELCAAVAGFDSAVPNLVADFSRGEV